MIDDQPDIGPIANSVIDFADGASATKTLNGLIGADENDASNQTGDGTLTYTFASYTTDTSVVSNLKGELIEDDARVVYFTDGEGGTADVYDDGIDTLFYDVVLDQDNGDYNFTVYQDPPPAYLEFDFSDLPSGQNLHGTIAADTSDPDGLGLLVFPGSADLDEDGEMTNASPTLNTSKGGGPVTIGNANQMIDPGESMFFAFVDDPDDDAIAGITGGLTQNTADDADEVGFQDTFTSDTSSVEIVQVQGGSLASMDIFAYDITLNSLPVGDGTVTAPDAMVQESRDFITDPLNGAATASYTQQNITEVKVYDGVDGTTLIFHATEGDGVLVDLADVSADFTGDKVQIAGIDDDYRIEFTSDGEHDLVQVAGVEGKFDIGGFNIEEAQPTPDQKFDYTIDIADFDGDTATDGFSVGLDGTGIYDDDAVIGV